MLHISRVGDPFVLHTDASGVAVGATLGQVDKDGVEHPLAFASHKLSGSQCNWSTIEREAYAIIWALDKFRDTVYGSKITVVCDHNPLQYIRDCARRVQSCYVGHLHSKNLTSKLSTNEVLIMWWRITYHVMCSVSLTMICTFCVCIYICMCMVYNMVMYELLCTIVYILSELLLAASCVQLSLIHI